MNWVGDLVQKQIRASDSVISLGCGIMQALGNWVEGYPKTCLKCGSLWGVDVHKPSLVYLERLNLGIHTLQADLNKDFPLPYPDKRFDVVLMLDVLEHLKNMGVVVGVIDEACRLARKKVIVFTPKVFRDNLGALVIFGLPSNPHQRHNLVVPKELLEGYGFKVKEYTHKYTTKISFYGVKKIK